VTAGAAAAIWFWRWPRPSSEPRACANANQAIPVVVEAAAKRDVPIWLDGLGTVQAFQTVTVKSMVDGPLLSVGFNEGQSVHAGDVLARIDPRTYQAALDSRDGEAGRWTRRRWPTRGWTSRATRSWW